MKSREKILFSKYTNFDEIVIDKVSSLGMALIGGTAIEVWGNYYGFGVLRPRSINDLDFISASKEARTEMSKWLKENINPDQVQVDIWNDNPPKPLIKKIGAILIMSPIHLIWQKPIRGNERDKGDIKYLLNLVTPEDLEFLLERLGVTDTEIAFINNIINDIEMENLLKYFES